jgi:CBS domain-containing protein
MKVEELMSENVIAVSPEASLKEVAATLAEDRISGLPVVDERRTVLGVISEADILVKEIGAEARHGGIIGWLLGGGRVDADKLAARTAGEAMTVPAITIGLHRHVSDAARLMTENGIKRLPVVDMHGVLVGILTRADLVRAFARPDPEIVREIRDDVIRRTLWIDEGRVFVRVERGEVTLSGSVDRKSDAEILPVFISRVPGVVSVRSELGWRWDDEKDLPASNPRVPIAPGVR